MTFRAVPDNTPGALRFTDMDGAQQDRLMDYLHSLTKPGRDAERREILLAIFGGNAPLTWTQQ